MNYSIKDTVFSHEEFYDLKWCVGEYKRLCREQATSEYGRNKLIIAENIAHKLDEIEWKNKNIK